MQPPPQVLILTGHPAVLERLNLPVAEAEVIWRRHYENLLSKLSMVPTIIVLESTPWTRGRGECMNRVAGPSSCVTVLDNWHLAKARAEASAVTTVPNAVFISSRQWFCHGATCPPVIDDTLLTADGLHLTLPASLALSDVLGRQVDWAINAIGSNKY